MFITADSSSEAANIEINDNGIDDDDDSFEYSRSSCNSSDRMRIL